MNKQSEILYDLFLFVSMPLAFIGFKDSLKKQKEVWN